MYNKDFLSNHTAYFEILKTRGLKGLQKDTPLWKLKLTDSEYDSIKQTLRSHTADLHRYGIEAALYYAEWWRRDYNGNIPSKEDVAQSLGLSRGYAEKLFSKILITSFKESSLILEDFISKNLRVLLNFK